MGPSSRAIRHPTTTVTSLDLKRECGSINVNVKVQSLVTYLQYMSLWTKATERELGSVRKSTAKLLLLMMSR